MQRLNRYLGKQATELQQANDELEAFSYSVSHDLRAPLRSIDGFSQALLEDYEEAIPQEGQDYLRRVRAASQRMGDLIDAMLNLSRLSRATLSYGQVDVGQLAREKVDALRERDPDREVTLTVSGDLQVRGDRLLLRALMDNLLENAWKFTRTRESAIIDVGMLRQNGGPAYFLRDDGVGFDMAYADKLFKAFQRLHSPDQFEGTGVGLATCLCIVRRHGGRLWAEGAVEQGATFYFTLGS